MSGCKYCSEKLDQNMHCHECCSCNTGQETKPRQFENYNLIVAVSKNNGIGLRGNLPWRIKEDLKYFSTTTKGYGKNAVIMGRKTWESLKGKHLKGRDNYILSSSLKYNNEVCGNIVKSFSNTEELDSQIKKMKYQDVWVIGGAEIYKEYLNKNKVRKCYLTSIDEIFECDTFFPTLSCEWKEKKCKELLTGERFKVETKIFEKINNGI